VIGTTCIDEHLSLLQELKQIKDEGKHKYDAMLAEGKKIAELRYVDIDEEHNSRLNQIAEQWQALWEKCDEWYEAATASQSQIKKQSEVSIYGFR